MEKSLIIEDLHNVFKRILYSSLGESASEALLFILRKELGSDPIETFWKDPKTVYHAMEKTLGAGAKVLINVLITRIGQEYGLNMKPEYFLDLMRRGEQSSIREIRAFLKRIAELHKKKSEKA